MPRGFECGNGWYDLIDRLCARIAAEVAAGRMPPVVASQVKEKLGWLRFRVRGTGNEATQELIFQAEEESMKTCEC